jgi:L-seryl-tRNA(Ser) seleniumtransferase
MKRRDLIKYLSVTPIAGAALAGDITSLHAAPQSLPGAPKKDYFSELGVRTFINAAGTYTAMTATLMRPATLDAIKYASGKFCMLDDLQDKVGERIAQITHAEAAVVTSGAFAALTLGMAGILTGKDPAKVKALPKLEGTGMKTEVICQNAHATNMPNSALAMPQRVEEATIRMMMPETVPRSTEMAIIEAVAKYSWNDGPSRSER